MSTKKTPKHIKLDERNHVEQPLLEQLHGLGWDIIDLTDENQKPGDTFRRVSRSRHAAGVARTTHSHQPLAGRRSGRAVVKQLTASFRARA